jgi:hypothetical protein
MTISITITITITITIAITISITTIITTTITITITITGDAAEGEDGKSVQAVAVSEEAYRGHSRDSSGDSRGRGCT